MGLTANQFEDIQQDVQALSDHELVMRIINNFMFSEIGEMIHAELHKQERAKHPDYEAILTYHITLACGHEYYNRHRAERYGFKRDECGRGVTVDYEPAITVEKPAMPLLGGGIPE